MRTASASHAITVCYCPYATHAPYALRRPRQNNFHLVVVSREPCAAGTLLRQRAAELHKGRITGNAQGAQRKRIHARIAIHRLARAQHTAKLLVKQRTLRLSSGQLDAPRLERRVRGGPDELCAVPAHHKSDDPLPRRGIGTEGLHGIQRGSLWRARILRRRIRRHRNHSCERTHEKAQRHSSGEQ